MTIELHDAVNEDGLIDVQGYAFGALALLYTAAHTTIPAGVVAFYEQFHTRADADDLDMAATMDGLEDALATWQSSASVLASKVRTNLQLMIREVVANDATQTEDSLEFAIQYVIDQMVASGEYVAGNTISLTLTPAVTNVGDPVICYSTLRGDGLANQNILAETIAITVNSTSGPTLRLRSPAAQSNRLAENWPLGSGLNTILSPASSLVSNGTFETTTIANVPDDWMIHVGVPGTTVKVTSTEVQSIAIAGSPTGGSYLLQWTGPDSLLRSTGPLAYDASSSDVEAALQAIPGLEQVTVSSTGTSPNYTHSVTLTGAVGNPGQLVSVNDLTGGSPTITHGTTTASSDGAYQGRALEFDSNGTEVTALYHALSLTADTVYFVHARVKRVGAAAAGEARIEIVNGVGGTVIADAAGNDAEHVIDVTATATASHDSEWFSFRVPPGTAMPVYLRIRISTAISNTASLFFDDVVVVQATRLYAGGPYVALVAGATPSDPDDTWTLAAANNRAGKIQEYYNRVFGMADKDLLLPVAGTGLIPPTWP